MIIGNDRLDQIVLQVKPLADLEPVIFLDGSVTHTSPFGLVNCVVDLKSVAEKFFPVRFNKQKIGLLTFNGSKWTRVAERIRDRQKAGIAYRPLIKPFSDYFLRIQLFPNF